MNIIERHWTLLNTSEQCSMNTVERYWTLLNTVERLWILLNTVERHWTILNTIEHFWKHWTLLNIMGIGYMALWGFGAKYGSGWIDGWVEWSGYALDCFDYQSKKSIPGIKREKKPLKFPTQPNLASERAVVGVTLILGWHLETPILRDKRSTGCSIHSSFLVLSGLKRVSLWMWSLVGSSQQPFPCALGHFRHCDDKQTNERTNNQVIQVQAYSWPVRRKSFAIIQHLYCSAG